MENYWWCSILFRIVLPLVIIIAICVRPTVTTYMYMLIGCYMPFFSVPTVKTMVGSTGTYMKILLIICILTTVLVISFYFTIYFPRENGHELKPCSTIEIIIRTLGVVEIKDLTFKDALPWCLPEPLMLVTSLALYFSFKKLCQDTDVTRAAAAMEGTELIREIQRKKLLSMMLHSAKYLLVFMFCLNAVLEASLWGSIYYLVFLTVITYWACNRSLSKVFARMLALLIPIMFVNMSIVFLYQFQYFQDSEVIDSKKLLGRLFNLIDIKTYQDCNNPRVFKLHAHSNQTYAIPGCLFFLYYLTVLISREILQAKDGVIPLFFTCCQRKKPGVPAKWQRALSMVQDQLEDRKLAATSFIMTDRFRNGIEQMLQFIINMSYLTANFVMMVWAITYVSWKTIVLLIWANLIWLLPFRKRVMLSSSPFLVAWVWFLLGSSYLYFMDLTEEELPSTVWILNFRVGVDPDSKIKWVHMLTKSMFGIIIFVTMRQFWEERALMKQRRQLAEAVGLSGVEEGKSLDDDIDSPNRVTFLERFQSAFLGFFAIWWIWVVILTMIWMDFWTTSNLFRIAFVGLAILCIMTFQLCPFIYWKKFLRVFWWIVIVYAMVNLFVVYMYQTSFTRNVFHKYIAEEDFIRYGFQVWTNRKLRSLALANPLFFQIAVVIQQNYFQDEFDRLTSPIPHSASAEDLPGAAKEESKWRKVQAYYSNTKNVVFEILEVHLHKIILLVGWYMCVFDLCALYVPFVLLFAACCAFGRKFTNISIYLVSFLVQILIVLRLIYMNLYSHHDSWDYVGHYTRNGKPYNKTLNSADWLGFHKSRLGKDYADFWQLTWSFLYVFVVTIMRVVSIRMDNYRVAANAPSVNRKVLFPEITYENCHDSTRAMLKFLANYGFYKFGCEITLVFASILMGLRMDAVAIMTSLWLLVMFPLNRRWMRILWLPMLVLAVAAIPAEYLATLGFWPTYWDKSLTRFWNSNDLLLRVQQFCHMMNLAHPPKKEKISLSFWYLLLTSLQWRSFERERRLRGPYYAAGSNDDVSNFIDDKDVKNPVPDFLTYTRSYLDVFKRILFTAWFYVSLLCTFLAGIMRPGVYSFGYILGAFVFVWEGTDMFLRPPRSILWRWNLLIGYTVIVMVTRTIGQIFVCILRYETYINLNCAMLRIFAKGCVDKFHMTAQVPNLSETSSCDVDGDTLGLGFDCLCFFFLIFQRRAFQSYHFFHIVNDAKAKTILADRGAELIEDGKQKKRQSLDAEDALIRNNIEKKMAQMRARHQNVQGNAYLNRKKNHRHMLKSGDYYLFDDASLNNDIHLLPVKTEDDDNEFDPYDPMNLTEYFGLLHSTNIRSVLAERSLRRRQKSAVQKGKKPEELKKVITVMSAQPGTSSRDPDPPIKLSKARNISDSVIFIWGFFESSIVSITGLINRRTKDFRHILTKMNRDMRILKEKTTYAQGIRLGSNKIWHPVESYRDLLSADKSQIFDRHTMQYSVYAKLLRATWYLLLSHSEWFCYFLIILNQVVEADFIALPLVILIFCWGALTVPKPTKTFWVVIFAYLLVMLFIKSFFLLDLAPWNVATNSQDFNLFFPPVVIGVTNISNLTYDALMLAAFFFHRIVLQMLGLWKPFNYRSASLISDGDYIMTDGKLVPLAIDGTRKSPETFEAKSTSVPMGDYFPRSIVHGITKYAEGFMLFAQQLMCSSSTHIPVDVYTPMFLCDLINLFLIMFFYESFASDENDAGLIGFIENNRVPLSFIISILVFILLMIIDRAIYLRKNRFMKILYHFIQVMTYHIWFFVLHPLFTYTLFEETPVVQVFYAFKCLYFLFSAYQIRNGYPRLLSHHFLLRGTTIFNRFGYKLYMVIPYLFELRTLLDWICTDSCLGVNDWFKMEEITENIFDQKCEQDIEEKWYEPAGKPKSHTKKYLLGGFLYVLLILTVIFPFLVFSLGNTVGVTTHPAKIKLELYMGTSEPIFQSYASEKNLKPLSEADYRNLTGTFNNIDQSELIFEDFKPEDVIVVTWSTHSLTKWKVSPGSFRELMEDLWSNDTFAFRLEIHYIHKGHGGHKEERTFGQTTYLPPLPNVQRRVLINMLEANKSLDVPAWMPMVLPKFLMISQESLPRSLPLMEGTTTVNYSNVKQDLEDEDDDEDLEASPKLFRNLLLSLRYNQDGDMWWHVQEECSLDDDNYFYYLKNLVHNGCDDLIIYTFNEKVFSHTMSYITQSGIVGLYLLYFMMVIGIIRSCRIEIGEIWIEDLSNSDDVFRKCMEVYVAREMGNYELEEELFAELIFIMRSRETLIKMTRYKDSPYKPPTLDSGVKK